MAGTKRHPIYRPPHRVVTHKAVELFRLGLSMDPADPDLIDVATVLHRELGRKPWEADVFDMADEESPRRQLLELCR